MLEHFRIESFMIGFLKSLVSPFLAIIYHMSIGIASRNLYKINKHDLYKMRKVSIITKTALT